EIMANNEIKQNIWAIRFALLHLLNSKVNVWPTQSWVENIGVDGSGTNFTSKHSGKNRYSDSVANKTESLVNSFPIFIKENFSQKQLIKFFDGNMSQRFVAIMKKMVKLLLRRVS
ncbi:MAG TPA: hypothetical protein VKO63_07410, partial [Chitinispirillaceae bacterium]|nr:hypothetical protein [Chitinispirillaceae bacterium]